LEGGGPGLAVSGKSNILFSGGAGIGIDAAGAGGAMFLSGAMVAARFALFSTLFAAAAIRQAGLCRGDATWLAALTSCKSSGGGSLRLGIG